jgi:hypothetical protein
LINFLFKQSAKNQRKRDASNYAQRQLEDFQSRVQEKQPPAWSSSTRQIENEVNAQLKVFQSYVRDIKEASLRLEELSKMLKSGEISENIYKLLLNELSSNLSLSVEQIFKIREVLEVLKAKAKIEWAREKIGIKQFEEQDSRNIFREDLYYKEVYSPTYRWQEIINRIDEALSSLTFEEELSLIERYLSIVKERASPSKEIEEAKMICQQRLSALSEKWSSMRREKIGRIMDLELQASQIRDNIKEVEVRFAVGEMDRNIYESKISALQSSLRKIEREISEIRNYIDEIDLKIFRSSELLREI